MPHKFDVQHRERLHDPSWRQLDPDEVLSFLPLAPRQRVADIGCGTGFFTLPLARRLSQGRVWGIDIAPEMLARLEERVAEAGLSNVKALKSEELSIPLPPGGADGALLAFVLHETEDRQAFLKEAAGLLKVGGWLGLVEWEKKDTGMGPPVGDRIDLGEARQLALGAGLRVVDERPLRDKFYFMLLRK
ncbi:MAG: class I SAM-dependent methyltransferase [Chloroflexota bacterium]|nr:class I SAM-dependent methyltransferase [Chloroflexota bacterium]